MHRTPSVGGYICVSEVSRLSKNKILTRRVFCHQELVPLKFEKVVRWSAEKAIGSCYVAEEPRTYH